MIMIYAYFEARSRMCDSGYWLCEICPLVRKEKLGSCLKYFREISHFCVLRISVEKIPSLVEFVQS